jgi:peptidoglycan hydrolase-like protein with peptidoglycan-binding domain
MNIISEIKRIKGLISLMEGNEKTSNVAIIGDNIAYLLNTGGNNEYSDLVSKDMDYKGLMDRLFTYEEVEDQVNNLFISIGSEDYFNPNLDVKTLINTLEEIFPNAKMHLIKGYVDAITNNLDEKNIESMEDNSIIFFKLFQMDKINVIGDHEVVGDGFLDLGDNILTNISDIIDEYENQDYYDLGDEEEVDVIEPTFKDLDIDEDADFDVIYEFIANLEKMVKSKNKYSTDLKNNYYGDVEIIQIALKFLGVNLTESLEITGKYDDKTKRSIEEYQSSKGISKTGIADTKTLTELLWDLKVKSFDDDDLAKFMGGLGVEIKQYTPDNYDLENIVDLIINNIEGGYAATEHFQKNIDKVKNADTKQALLNSGETMFGIDRKNGPTMTEFWKVVDENSGYTPESKDKPKWTHGHMGGDVEDELRELVYDWAIPTYESMKNSKLESTTKDLVDDDKRITTHLLYAVWNGPVFFNNFASTLNSAVSSGVTDRDELWDIAINSRRNYGNDLISSGASKIEKIANQ